MFFYKFNEISSLVNVISNLYEESKLNGPQHVWSFVTLLLITHLILCIGRWFKLGSDSLWGWNSFKTIASGYNICIISKTCRYIHERLFFPWIQSGNNKCCLSVDWLFWHKLQTRSKVVRKSLDIIQLGA